MDSGLDSVIRERLRTADHGVLFNGLLGMATVLLDECNDVQRSGRMMTPASVRLLVARKLGVLPRASRPTEVCS